MSLYDGCSLWKGCQREETSLRVVPPLVAMSGRSYGNESSDHKPLFLNSQFSLISKSRPMDGVVRNSFDSLIFERFSPMIHDFNIAFLLMKDSEQQR